MNRGVAFISPKYRESTNITKFAWAFEVFITNNLSASWMTPYFKIKFPKSALQFFFVWLRLLTYKFEYFTSFEPIMKARLIFYPKKKYRHILDIFRLIKKNLDNFTCCIRIFEQILDLRGRVSDFWDFRGLVQLEKWRLDIFET